jgi:L-asparaginase
MIDRPPSNQIYILSTGGTFDKTYDKISETLTFNGSSCVQEILRDASVKNYKFEELMQVDSLLMADSDRKLIFDHVSLSKYRKVVIIHGTSSMIDTARVFQASPLDGVYVFTGAMVPFRYSAIEASFNLGGAVALAKCAAPGVYIYMHGEVFDPSNAVKDEKIARFISTNS